MIPGTGTDLPSREPQSGGDRPETAVAAPLLILASSSPYRRELLARLGLPFETVQPEVDESRHAGESPDRLAARLAAAKAHAVGASRRDALVIGCDQVAALGNECLGKPGSHSRAVAQLRALRGQLVVFHTALALLDATNGSLQEANVPSIVRFREYDDDEIERYLARDRPYDCAGSAKIESLGIALVEGVTSDDPSALIGLPLIALVAMLTRAGVRVIR